MCRDITHTSASTHTPAPSSTIVRRAVFDLFWVTLRNAIKSCSLVVRFLLIPFIVSFQGSRE